MLTTQERMKELQRRCAALHGKRPEGVRVEISLMESGLFHVICDYDAKMPTYNTTDPDLETALGVVEKLVANECKARHAALTALGLP